MDILLHLFSCTKQSSRSLACETAGPWKRIAGNSAMESSVRQRPVQSPYWAPLAMICGIELTRPDNLACKTC